MDTESNTQIIEKSNLNIFFHRHVLNIKLFSNKFNKKMFKEI